MVDIVVLRGAGDYRGDDLVEPLLASETAARERGRNEIDEATPAAEARLTLAWSPLLRPGELVRVHERWGGPSWRGKITGVQHRLSADAGGNRQVETVLTVRRPRASAT